MRKIYLDSQPKPISEQPCVGLFTVANLVIHWYFITLAMAHEYVTLTEMKLMDTMNHYALLTTRQKDEY